MEEKDELASLRDTPFPEALAISSKLGEPEEEHILTTMETIRELTMAARVRTLRESSV